MGRRIGVFVCWCGSNIGGVVDVSRVAEAAKKFPGVVFTQEYKYTCSEPGQEMMVQAIKEHQLDRVVVASCSPRMHELTFRKTVARAGLNPYLMEMVNLREHCSWVHPDDPEGATEKAIALVRKAVAKAARLEPLYESRIGITKRALIIGGGIAGIQAALDIADHGYDVVMVEKEATIGGKMAILDKTFPTLDCSACICTPKMVDVAQHPRITLYTLAEVEQVSGYIGNFEVTIRLKARYVDIKKCTGCGLCETKCPVKVPSEFEQGLGMRSAIYKPFPQAVPNKPVIDADNCRKLREGKCGLCAKICPTGAVNYEDEDVFITEKVGAIVMATGFELIDWTQYYGEYGGGKYPDVITGLQFERLVNASGPTGGKIKRPSDGKVPETVVFIKCVSSRDDKKGKAYCSRVCCMYTAKHAIQVKEKLPDTEVYVFYMDARNPGKGYDEFFERAKKAGAKYIRGRVSKIYREGDKYIVKGEDTLIGRNIVVEADMVVLATAMVPVSNAADLAQRVGFSYDKEGFFTEAHPKLRPVETNTAGVFLAGCCQGPKDIPDTVAQASAAASKVTALFSRDEMETTPMIASVNPDLCSGCGLCLSICPYKALSLQETPDGKRFVASVNAGLCQGCGACTAECRPGALNLKGFTNEQVIAEVRAACLF
ncbi:MAG: heterodisulfide reductase subunit [Eubacteriales bacterium]|nr:heterodisulfide reductase subunit [Eubacteriales bacterium]MDN5364526.1 heterodisulfide reductase subunit [Eubacteriales bacterium]